MARYFVGQRVQASRGDLLIVAMVLGDEAMATTDGQRIGTAGGWCQHQDRREGYFEYFGGFSAGTAGVLDLDPRCRRVIDQWGPADRVTGRPADLGFEY